MIGVAIFEAADSDHMDSSQFQTQSTQSIDELRFFRRLPWEKMAIWFIFLLLIYALSDFLDIIVLTFVLSYIASNVVGWFLKRIGPVGESRSARQSAVAGIFIIFVAGIIGLGSIVLPTIYRQADNLVKRLSGSVRTDQKVENQNLFAGEENKPLEGLAPVKKDADSELAPPVVIPNSERSAESTEVKDMVQRRLRVWIGDERYRALLGAELFKPVVDSVLSTFTEKLPEWTRRFAEYLHSIVTILFHFLLSVIFSFLIVWDLPKLERTTVRLPAGRFRDFSREIFPSLYTFSSVMGRALQAQIIIALCNTVLTFIGLIILGVENKYFLSLAVFLCSFIPILGVFLSTVPMSVVAMLQEGGGFGLMLAVLIMVTILHLVEGYFLNPRIMGRKFEMNSLVVLIILMVGEHFFGIWGLLLGVPLCHYLLFYVIQGNEDPNLRESAVWKSLYPKSSDALVTKTEEAVNAIK